MLIGLIPNAPVYLLISFKTCDDFFLRAFLCRISSAIDDGLVPIFLTSLENRETEAAVIADGTTTDDEDNNARS